MELLCIEVIRKRKEFLGLDDDEEKEKDASVIIFFHFLKNVFKLNYLIKERRG